MTWMDFKPFKTVTVITYNYVNSRWDRPIRQPFGYSIFTRHKDNAIAQWYEADVTEDLSLTANMPSVDDGTELVCSCCCSHRCCWRQLTLIFFRSFIFSTPFPVCPLVCLTGVIKLVPSVLSIFWVLSVQHLMALLCTVCVHLCDELTVWWDTNMTIWLVTS